ncbi:VOC family protein [Klebsiella variicola]|uniref:VOC family protein n=1 Tax=Klebsiella variicola TaxID=244366 RepID=UPI00339C63B9
MNAVGQKTFGIDHPLVTVKDHSAVLSQYRAMGFSPSPVSHHPWGTVTSNVTFPGNFIEIIGVGDPSMFGTNSANGFCFGRRIGDYLERGDQGISILALHSKDADSDHKKLVAAGLESQGRVDFRRRMMLPDGSPDEAVVSLALFIDSVNPDISNFLCHQHRPELIWVKSWQQHANSVDGIQAVTYIGDPDVIYRRWKTIYGERVLHTADCVSVDTGCGILRAFSPEYAAVYYSGVQLPTGNISGPRAISITLNTPRPDALREILTLNNVPYVERDGRILISPENAGNVILEFISNH